MYGINTGVLGEARIRGLSQRIYEFADREEGFEKKKPAPKQTSEEEAMAKRIKRLENELAYTKQEVEFLKKVRAADMEAQKQWESKRKPK
jgi:methionyl-tRNA formyltransferase